GPGPCRPPRPSPSLTTCRLQHARRTLKIGFVHHWQKVALVGVGLLGGSLGQAIRHRKLAQRVVGYVRRQASVEECERLGAVDEAESDLLRAVHEADLIVLCTPIAQMRELS